MDYDLKDRMSKIPPVVLPECVFAIVASYLSGPDSRCCRKFSGNVLTRDYCIVNDGTNKILESRSNGVLHSFDDEPSETIFELYGNRTRYQYNWHHFGKLHRNFGLPARINFNSDMDVEVMFWYENGEQVYDASNPYEKMKKQYN